MLLILLGCSKYIQDPINSERIKYLVTTVYKGFETIYDQQYCSFQECVDRAVKLRENPEVEFSICLENVPVNKTHHLSRRSCK